MIDASIVLQKFMEKIGEIFDSFGEIDDLTVSINKETDQLGLDLLSEYIKWMDNEIRESQHRKKDWSVERNNDRNTILTEMGQLEYNRTYFVSKTKKRYAYLADECLGITVHQRMDKGFKDKLVNTATEISYEKATCLVGRDKVSRQTVKQAIHSFDTDMIKHVVLPGENEEKKKVPHLFVDADEDHISIKGKEKAEQKLVYVYEGARFNEKEGKNELVNPYYLTAVSGPELFMELYEYIKNNYDFNVIERIYIQGDGAHWIKGGTNIIPNSRFVLDKYHMMKQAWKCVGTDSEMRGRLWGALESGDMDELDVIMNEVIEKSDDEERDNIIKGFKYFYNNFDGIRIYSDPCENPGRCSAEGHVSHILSHRLSSRPLTWSEKGSDNMARLRVCLKNGGSIKDIRNNQEYVSEIEKTCFKRNRYLTDGHGMMYDVYHNITVLNKGHRTRLYEALRNLRGA